MKTICTSKLELTEAGSGSSNKQTQANESFVLFSGKEHLAKQHNGHIKLERDTRRIDDAQAKWTQAGRRPTNRSFKMTRILNPTMKTNNSIMLVRSFASLIASIVLFHKSVDCVVCVIIENNNKIISTKHIGHHPT